MRQSNTILSADFRECIECLNAQKVHFVLVGGYAVGWHGVVRATGDIDFLYEQTEENVQRLCAALHDFGAPPYLIDPAFLLSPDAVTQIGLPPLRIDLLASITGVTFGEVRAGAEQIELEGQRVLVIGLTELRANKGATQRAKDKTDLGRLNAIPSTATPRAVRSKKGKARGSDAPAPDASSGAP